MTDPVHDSVDHGLTTEPSLTPYDDLDELSRLDKEGPALELNDQIGIKSRMHYLTMYYICMLSKLMVPMCSF